MEIHFLRQPGGGVLTVEAAGTKARRTWKPTGPKRSRGYQTFPLSRARAKSTFRWIADRCGSSVSVSKETTPGVIYNSLGLNGGQVQVVVRYFDKPQWTEELQHQHPDLVVINYGTNESIYADYIERSYPGELRQVIERVKAAVPRASVLIMSPMDRGQRDSSSRITTVPTLPRLVDIQRQMAAETGCAFFNTFQAMGGEGTMARWYDSYAETGECRLHASAAGRRAQGGSVARSGARIGLPAIQSARAAAETALVIKLA